MKKLIALTAAAVLVLAFSITAFAAYTTISAPRATPGYGYGYCQGGYNFMWGADGTTLSRADAEAKLDQYIEDGYILESDKDYYLEMYDYCIDKGIKYGNRGFGMRGARGGGGCCGGWR